MYRYLSIIIFFIASLSGIGASAQKWALKSNLLYDATATINAGAEVALAPRWSLDVSANLNAWTFSEGKR